MAFKARRLLKNKRVILASQSPRRKELLKLLCDDFEICPAQGDEMIPCGVNSRLAAEALAEAKCREVAEKSGGCAIVIGCDTTVLLEDEILGKPANKDDAFRMLKSLSGKTHEVVSGTAVYIQGEVTSFSEITRVTFRRLSDEDIMDYIETGESYDKAGAYGIQGLGSLLVDRIEGDYFNVVGLPVSRLAVMLEKLLQ